MHTISHNATVPLKGHGNEADFLGFLHKLSPHRSLTLPFEAFHYWLRIRGDIEKWLGDSASRRLSNSVSRGVGDSQTRRVGESAFECWKENSKTWKKLYRIYRQSCRLTYSPSQGVVFPLRISPRIGSQNRHGSKCSVRDLCRTDLCKNPRKSASLPCPFNVGN